MYCHWCFCVNVLFYIGTLTLTCTSLAAHCFRFYFLLFVTVGYNRVTLACPRCISVNEAPSTQRSALSFPRINKRFWSWMQLFTSNNSSLSKSFGYSEKGKCAIQPYSKHIGGYILERKRIRGGQKLHFWGLERNQKTRMRLESFNSTWMCKKFGLD